MRRKDREMSKAFGLEVIDKATHGVLSVAVPGEQAYGVPLTFAREGDTLFFHSAQSGRKTELLNNGAKVHVVFVGECKVPNVMSDDEAEQASLDPKQFGLLVSKLFTTEFESAMVEGTIRLLEDDEEKTHGLRLICEKYTPQWMRFFPQAIESGLKLTNVYGIDILEVMAKRKKFDADGQEMKWQRMELKQDE